MSGREERAAIIRAAHLEPIPEGVLVWCGGLGSAVHNERLPSLKMAINEAKVSLAWREWRRLRRGGPP